MLKAYLFIMSYNRYMDDTIKKVTDFFITYPQRIFTKQQVVIYAETTVTEVFFIVEGRVSQYDITPAGNEVVVNIFKPGAFFPMSAAINNAANPYYFEASTKVTAHVAPAGDAVQFLKDNPDVTFNLLSRVYSGIDGVLRRMAHLMGGDAKSRLVFELLNAAYRFGETQNDGATFIPLKESDIAKHSGLARETVNRNIQDLKTAGLVNVTRSGISISNIKQLEATLGTSL